MLSAPVPPSSVSLPLPPDSVSLPPPPVRLSLPSSPDSVLAATLPMITLSLALPVPLIAAVPVSVRFSRFTDSVCVTEASTRSMPPATSEATSPRLSTT